MPGKSAGKRLPYTPQKVFFASSRLSERNYPRVQLNVCLRIIEEASQ
jgi:hypothetical protein